MINSLLRIMSTRSNSSVTNTLTPEEIERLVKRLEENGQLVDLTQGVKKCLLASHKYPQITLRGNIKPLVHQVYWRYKNSFALIPEGKEISHLTGNRLHAWPTVAEDPEVNNDRKGCHSKHPALGWAQKGLCNHTPKCIHIQSE